MYALAKSCAQSLAVLHYFLSSEGSNGPAITSSCLAENSMQCTGMAILKMRHYKELIMVDAIANVANVVR